MILDLTEINFPEKELKVLLLWLLLQVLLHVFYHLWSINFQAHQSNWFESRLFLTFFPLLNL